MELLLSGLNMMVCDSSGLNMMVCDSSGLNEGGVWYYCSVVSM